MAKEANKSKRSLLEEKKFFMNIMRQIVERIDSMENTAIMTKNKIPLGVIIDFDFSPLRKELLGKIDELRIGHKRRIIADVERKKIKEEIATLYCQMTKEEKMLMIYEFVKAKNFVRSESSFQKKVSKDLPDHFFD